MRNFVYQINNTRSKGDSRCKKKNQKRFLGKIEKVNMELEGKEREELSGIGPECERAV